MTVMPAQLSLINLHLTRHRRRFRRHLFRRDVWFVTDSARGTLAVRLPSATNPDITSEDCDTCNRVALSDALQGQVDASYVYNDLGIQTAAVMHDSSDYGLGLAEIFASEFEALGGTVVTLEGVQVGDTDFRAVLTTIATDSPELLFFGGYAYRRR